MNIETGVRKSIGYISSGLHHLESFKATSEELKKIRTILTTTPYTSLNAIFIEVDYARLIILFISLLKK